MQSFRFRIKSILIAGAVLGALGIVALGFKGSAGIAQTLPRDCDATSIIYCGSLTLDELKTDYNSNDNGRYPDIPAVFNHFDISSADVNGMNSSNHKRGIVKADNTVWLDGKLIGTNAYTAGRVNKPGSTAIPGTSAFKRHPSVSFASSSTQIDAFIGFENGEPAWAILSSCGNPVTWDKPPAPEKPVIEIEKTIRSADNNSWVEDDTFANNSTLTYRILVKNTGKAADTNVVVKDTLPASHNFVEGSVRVNGQAVQSGDALVDGGITLPKVDAGATFEITFQAKVSVDEDKCDDIPFTNKAIVDGELTPPKEDKAGGEVRIVCAQIKCVSLKASALAVQRGSTITFTAEAKVENATLQSYEFRIEDDTVQDSQKNTYVYNANDVGDFTVAVTVKTDKGNDSGSDCRLEIKVSEKPVCPHNPSLPPEHPDCVPPEEPQVQGASTLPATGAGGLAGLFVTTSLSGAVMHHLIVNRRRD